jgi:hypothetical protein
LQQNSLRNGTGIFFEVTGNFCGVTGNLSTTTVMIVGAADNEGIFAVFDERNWSNLFSNIERRRSSYVCFPGKADKIFSF